MIRAMDAEPEGPGPSALDAFVISLDGEFDLAERTHLLDAFAVTMNTALVVVDFHKTRYIDSTVIECLIAFQQTSTRRGAKLVLAGLRPEIRRIFDVCSLDRIFDIRSKLSDVEDLEAVDAERLARLTLVATPIDPEAVKYLWRETR